MFHRQLLSTYTYCASILEVVNGRRRVEDLDLKSKCKKGADSDEGDRGSGLMVISIPGSM
jgi:hypothetical protein